MTTCDCLASDQCPCTEPVNDPVCAYVLPKPPRKANDFMPKNCPFDGRTIYNTEYIPKKPCKPGCPVPVRDCSGNTQMGPPPRLMDAPPVPVKMESKYDNEYVMKPANCPQIFRSREQEETLKYSEKALMAERFKHEHYATGTDLYSPPCRNPCDCSDTSVKKIVSQAKIDTGCCKTKCCPMKSTYCYDAQGCAVPQPPVQMCPDQPQAQPMQMCVMPQSQPQAGSPQPMQMCVMPQSQPQAGSPQPMQMCVMTQPQTQCNSPQPQQLCGAQQLQLSPPQPQQQCGAQQPQLQFCMQQPQRGPARGQCGPAKPQCGATKQQQPCGKPCSQQQPNAQLGNCCIMPQPGPGGCGQQITVCCPQMETVHIAMNPENTFKKAPMLDANCSCGCKR